VSVLVVARNEQRTIARRIENLLGLDYPRRRLEILVGSDGSTDATAEVASSFAGRGVRVLAFAEGRGKAAVLNDLAARASGRILVLADARQRFAVDALRRLVLPFSDPRVGAVSGDLILTDDPDHTEAAGAGIGFYWRYEKFIRGHESRVDSTIGVSGAIWAVRRRLYRSLPGDTLLDDVLGPMRVVRRGYRVLFEPAARAFDRVAASARDEFRRKVRTIGGNFQLFARHRWLLSPRANRLWLQTVSHKVLRLLSPLLFAVALASSLGLAVVEPAWVVVLTAELGLCLLALEGHVLRDDPRARVPFVTVPYALALMNWATLVGFWRFATARLRWEPRLEPPAARRASAS
jgi:cellulose synthase/poly-beta-1,6-N-acetylglucosamine synthase-like glycosyltransferase